MESNHRPWGFYEVLEDMAGHKIKKIVVHAGGRLSLQRHRHRSEHWHIVQGTATVTIGRNEFRLQAGNSADIPAGCLHRIANLQGKDDLIFVEIQAGTYFGEDDIERIEDDYGRRDSSE